MPRRLRAFLIAATSMLVAAPAVASMTVALDMRGLVTRADHVVVGTVVRQQARRDSRRRIVTDVTIRVDEKLKGRSTAGDEIVVRCLGGVMGDIGMRVEGEPRFTDGQRGVMFVARRSGRLRPVGMSQGVLPIDVTTAGRELVHPGGAGLSLVRRVQGGQLIPAPAALLEARPLGDVLTEIRALVDETGGR